MRRRREEPSHGGLERWLLTYADMITLLMAFFIMMYSMSILNLAKFRQVAFSIRSGFGGIVRGQGKSVLGSSGIFGSKPSPIEGDTAGVSWRVIKPLVEYVENDVGIQGVAGISEEKRGIVITLASDKLLFNPGSAVLTPRARAVVDKIADVLKQIDNPVQIEGHTCDLPPRSSKYKTNWELSTARATAVLRYLVEVKGLDEKRFSAAGYGSVRPVVQNTNNLNRSRNRRVEIVILRPEVSAAMMPSSDRRRISDPNKSTIQRRLD